ncbi:hypothetical protein FOZ60_011202 [Perkinsus olseni]|uniref:Uncharacterized protein n=1 Tax=Perkinsus olseni TaxID=32597 RepID=A0A7J6NE44_PEROL|nr:hypothetical protein FOZ60_011202 [Perkinsus olseni]
MLGYAMSPLPSTSRDARTTPPSASTIGLGECCDSCVRGLSLVFGKDNGRRGKSRKNSGPTTEPAKGISLSLDDEAVQEPPAGAGGGTSVHRHTALHRGIGSSGDRSPKRIPTIASCPHAGFFAVHPPKHRVNNGFMGDPAEVAQECKTPVFSILKRTCEEPGEFGGSRDETSSEEPRWTRDRVHSLLVPLRYDRHGERIDEHGKHHVSFNDIGLEKRTHPCESSFSPPSDPMSVAEFNRMRKWAWKQQRQREARDEGESFLTFRMRAMSI